MNDDKALTHQAFVRKKVREAMRAERLPKRSPDRVWGGRGSGVRCCICDTPITSDQTELELEFVPEDRSPSAYYLVHLHCFSAFEVERELATEDTAPGTNPRPDSALTRDALAHAT